jgi:GT2 family glycosyltransferase
LRSVGAQTHTAFEIIVVDDGSTDGSLAAARSAAVPFTLLRTQRGGVSVARNAGLKAASGTCVSFLDQDDIWHPSHLASQLECLKAHPEAGVVVSPYQHWYPGPDGFAPSATVFPAPAPAESDPAFSGWVYHQFMRDCWALTSATTLRRDVLLEHCGFNENLPYSEDWDLWLRLSRTTRFVKLNGPPVLYRQHAVQGSRTARNKDYRCDLLLANARAHGLSSRDGRSVGQAEFEQTLARYQMEFGWHQLRHGDRALGVRSLLRAWRRNPTAWRWLALALAGAAGWPARSKVLELERPAR